MRPPERARRLRGSSISNKAPLPGAWDKIEHAIEAARNRTHALAAAQNKLGVEWGGWIVKLPDGRFTFTTPFTSDLSVSLAAQEWAYNAFDIPGATPVLPFHSHPSSSSFSWNDYLVIAPGPYGKPNTNLASVQEMVSELAGTLVPIRGQLVFGNNKSVRYVGAAGPANRWVSNLGRPGGGPVSPPPGDAGDAGGTHAAGPGVGSRGANDYRETGGPKPTTSSPTQTPTGGESGTPSPPPPPPEGGAGGGGGGSGPGSGGGTGKVKWYPHDGTVSITGPNADGMVTVTNNATGETETARYGEARIDSRDEHTNELSPPPGAQKTEDAPPPDEEDENAQQNTTRGNPLDDDGGDDHESRRFTHHYMPPETRALFAFTELGRALAPKGPPLPGSGGPTDRGWTPFRARNAAAAPPESAAYGREALKNAFADGAIGGALAGRPYHGPTDDGGQVPVAADARTSGDESDADAKASRDAVRQMIWNKFAAPRIRYARRMQ